MENKENDACNCTKLVSHKRLKDEAISNKHKNTNFIPLCVFKVSIQINIG